MSTKHHQSFDVGFLIFISLIGLVITVALTAYPPITARNLTWRKPLIGSIYSLICILGTIAVFSPNNCLKILEFQKKNPRNFISNKVIFHKVSPSLRGHHPSCGNFVAHIFQIGNKIFCAACTGLLFGGLLALAGALFYFFGSFYVAEPTRSVMVLLGILGVGLGFFQFKFRNIVRLSLNSFFVLGTLFILIGIDEIVHSLMVDLFIVSLILFWLFTRISLSQWDHKRICSSCNVTSCELAD